MLKRLLCCLLLAAMVLSCAFASDEAENLFFNPDCAVENGEAAGWDFDAWDGRNSDYACLSEGGIDDSSCLYIRNNEANDARFVQTLFVEPNTLYRVSCRVKAAGIDADTCGANLSVPNMTVYSSGAYDTEGEWQELVIYGFTGEDQTELTIYARIGGYSSVTCGEAWFDDFECIEAEELPEDTDVWFFSSYYSSNDDDDAFLEDFEETAPASPSPAAILIVSALFLALTALFFAGNARYGSARTVSAPRATLCLILALAFIARLITALFIRGYSTDLSCFMGWASRVYSLGPGAFYEAGFCDYPPGYIYILWIVGFFQSLPGIGFSVLAAKLPNILADLGAAYVIWRIAKKQTDTRSALLLCLFYAFNPAMILDSAGWGQTDGLLSLAVMVSILLLYNRKIIPGLISFAIAGLLKPQAFLFAPLCGIVLILRVAKSDNKRRDILTLCAGIAAAALTMILLACPFAGSKDPVSFLIGLYTGTLGSYSYYAVSACNFYELLGLNWVALDASVAVWISYIVPIALCTVTYVLRSKEEEPLYLLCALVLALMFTFGLKMHERYILPIIILLCSAYAMRKDIRILICAALFTIVGLSNMGIVLLYEYTLFAPVWLTVGTALICLVSTALLTWAALDRKTYGVTRIYHPSAQRIRQQEKAARNPVLRTLTNHGDYRMHLSLKEIITVGIVTVCYSVFTFVNLGSTTAPQTGWTSTAPGEQIVFDLGKTETFKMTYYGGICNSTFTVEFSDDGETYTDPALAQYDQGEIFRWIVYRPMYRSSDGKLMPTDSEYACQTARYIRITVQQSGLILSEVGFLAEDSAPLPIASLISPEGNDAVALVDEQDIIPDHPSYYNGTYFDEIYHVRTAYEHLHGLHTYEWTHPPLGKLLIACGIALFGMTPFGWRFAGALSGVIMVPLMYLMMRQLSKNKFAAFTAMMLLTLDCMHFTQSRIGTIDCYAVMFIMLMYLFMFRYAKMSFYHEKLSRTLVPLALCGLSFALGCASKWICIYAGLGLAVIFFMTLWRRFSEYRAARNGILALTPEEKKHAQTAIDNFVRCAVITCLWCCVFFIALPLTVYYFSYYWQLMPDGNFSVQSVIDLQKTMLNYHAGLGNDTHYFRSPWYEWPLIIKPMWYYSGTDFMPKGWISSISCMGNPAVWWGSLAALFYTLWKLIRTRGRAKNALLVVIGFMSQFLPWVLVPRSTFIYHYFASVPFIILCSGLLLADIDRRNHRAALTVGSLWIGASAVLCGMFYPLMSGTPIPRAYAKYLRWFSWYNY